MTGWGRRGSPINASGAGRWGGRILGVVESAMYVLVAIVLAGAAFAVLWRAFVELLRSAVADQSQAMLSVLDELLLVFIFVELLYAVRVTLKERRVSVEPFLIAGILASIKEIIVLSVKAANNFISQGPEFSALSSWLWPSPRFCSAAGCQVPSTYRHRPPRRNRPASLDLA